MKKDGKSWLSHFNCFADRYHISLLFNNYIYRSITAKISLIFKHI